jgi:hypothetical protein
VPQRFRTPEVDLAQLSQLRGVHWLDDTGWTISLRELLLVQDVCAEEDVGHDWVVEDFGCLSGFGDPALYEDVRPVCEF